MARDDDERRTALDPRYDLERALSTSDLVGGDNVVFAATGVTDGALLSMRARASRGTLDTQQRAQARA